MNALLLQRGETLIIPLDADGDVAEVSAVTANAKLARFGAVPATSVTTAFSWTVTARAATSEFVAGWDLTYPAASSASLATGSYATTVELTLTDGNKRRSNPIFWRLQEVTLT
jgi:hypothetical protein